MIYTFVLDPNNQHYCVTNMHVSVCVVNKCVIDKKWISNLIIELTIVISYMIVID